MSTIAWLHGRLTGDKKYLGAGLEIVDVICNHDGSLLGRVELQISSLACSQGIACCMHGSHRGVGGNRC